MWIAKNDITGKTYGHAFDSIFDCQKYIDTQLVILQYEWRRIAYLESEAIDEEEIKKLIKEKYNDNPYNAVAIDIMARIEYSLNQYANDYQRPGNVIRCWYVEQGRYADGFDF